MLDFNDAQKQLAQAAHPIKESENCVIAASSGRILAQPVTASHNLPPADNSAMDGYAIRYADYAVGKPLPIQQRCFAGEQPEPLQPGQCIRLFTGSLIPEGADTVVMQEDCEERDNQLLILEPPRQFAHVRKQGEDVKQGQTLLPAGTRMQPAHIAILASQGLATIPVYRQLRVGILTTGDELAIPGEALKPAQIYNSNSPMLATLTQSLGAEATHVLHALDTHESLDKAFATLLADCDLILTVGGVSVGEKDLVKPTIENLGGSLDMWRVAMKPGKPVALAHIKQTPVVCLPGNPVSAFAVFVLLVSPMVRRMQGRQEWFPPQRYGTLDHFKGFNETRDEFIRVKAHYTNTGSTTLEAYPQQASGIISSLPWSSGLARIPANTRIEASTLIDYYDWADWLY